MSTERRLATWLQSKSADERRVLLERTGFVSEEGVNPRALARLLLQYHVTLTMIGECTLPQSQALSAVAWLAARRHGGLTGYWHTMDPSTRAVPRTDVIDLLAGTDQGLRADAKATLDDLSEMALVLPPHGKQVVVALGLHVALADSAGLGRPAAELLTAHFNAPEVHRIAAELGFPKAGTREGAQRNVLDMLSDPDRVRALLTGAPASVRDHLDTVIRHGSRVLSHVYEGAYDYSPNPKIRFREGGSGDQDTDWLARRGLLLPSGAEDVAEVPIEVATAVLGEPRMPFTPRPPQPPADLPPAPQADGSAQAAITAAISQIERLLAVCAEQPLALRKSGGIAVRDTRRAAKAAGTSEETARFWLDLAAQAQLLAPHAEPVERPKGYRGRLPDPVVTLLPTGAYDTWLGRAPAERLVPFITTWAGVLPPGGQWPVALTAPDDPYAVGARYALFEALAALPPGKGGDTLPYLLACATWHRPHQVAGPPDTADQLTAILREAELLGTVATGTLTDAGRTVLDLLRSGQAWTPVEERLASALTGMLPAPQATAVFQADLTAVVRGIPTGELAALLDESADRESEGHAVVWRFSAATVRRALDAGHDADELLTRLAAVTTAPLPQPLEYLIKDVGRTHGRMRVVRSGCCVRSDDETLIDELARTRALAKLGLHKIAPTVLISSVGERETLAGLRSAGYTPVLEDETGAAVIERPSQRRAAPS
ncbi:hypothetical protein Aph01nite_35080 [Acrocarpospora phusangensis]|uniref:Helicase XPB/Ssl2 N-terminal domain-containing protein n=1 Tax=Acrocarpospora phusangensis TaxID=1070424 RepID=A0A919QD14_9ACTN|nr:helicase-associated domain-containing protein [Acrocarpospora phusangensis]GIH25198.1 hypothetical protein Aph01nite_35080 [Acrocarpospora phusangensis]